MRKYLYIIFLLASSRVFAQKEKVNLLLIAIGKNKYYKADYLLDNPFKAERLFKITSYNFNEDFLRTEDGKFLDSLLKNGMISMYACSEVTNWKNYKISFAKVIDSVEQDKLQILPFVNENAKHFKKREKKYAKSFIYLSNPIYIPTRDMFIIEIYTPPTSCIYIYKYMDSSYNQVEKVNCKIN